MTRLSTTFPSVKLTNPRPSSNLLSCSTSLPKIKSEATSNSPSKSKSRSWSVYLILSTNAPIKTYVGVTTDFSRRSFQFIRFITQLLSGSFRAIICHELHDRLTTNSIWVLQIYPLYCKLLSGSFKVIIFQSYMIDVRQISMWVLFILGALVFIWAVFSSNLPFFFALGWGWCSVMFLFPGYDSGLMRRMRSLKQHNGELKGGAKASRAGRPWICACLVHGFKDQNKACAFESKWKTLSRSLPRKRMDNSKTEQANDLSLALLQHREAALNRVKGIFDCTDLEIDWKLNSL